MTFNIKGHYKFKQNGRVLLEGDNLITFYGEIFLLNRCINDEFEPMKYIVLGNSKNIPSKTDISLGNETCRHNCSKEVDINDTVIRLTSSFTAQEVIGVTEIGVCNDRVLISHDVFNRIDNTLISNLIGTIDVEYSFIFRSSSVRQDWSVSSNPNLIHTYYIYEPSYVTMVVENGVHGYKLVGNVNEVNDTKGSYYYDVTTRNLYIHPYNEYVDINSLEISVQNKYTDESIDKNILS